MTTYQNDLVLKRVWPAGHRSAHVERTATVSCLIWKIRLLLYVAFCTIMAISRQKEARSRDYALLLFRMTSRVLYSAQYHRQHCTLHAFEQFGALYIHSHDDKYPSRPGFEPGTPKFEPQSIQMNHRGRSPYLQPRQKIYSKCMKRHFRHICLA